MTCRILAAATLAGFACVNGAALDAEQGVFRSGVDMVPLTVTVTDAAGNYKTGLTAADFAIFEDGTPQTVSFFASEDVPVDIAFVVDTSASMYSALPLVKTALHGLLRELRDGDRGTAIEVKQAVSMPQRLTTDRDAIHGAIDSLRAGGSTAMYDGLYLALREFERARRKDREIRRQILILLSDGLDNSSHVTFDAASDLARRPGVSIYTIALKEPVVPSRIVPASRAELEATYAMRALALEAGGRAFVATGAGELPSIYHAIGQELACQYQLGYVPAKPADGAFRHVSVRILPPTRATARTRSGYIAVRAAPAAGARTTSRGAN